MISSLKIDGYRGLRHLAIEGLGRVNLLVGTNNCGKTSVLEAVNILESSGDVLRIWETLWRRGERNYRELPGAPNTQPRIVAEGELAHLFCGHELRPGSRFTVSAHNDSPQRTVEFAIRELLPNEKVEGQQIEDEDGHFPRLVLDIISTQTAPVPTVLLSKAGAITAQVFRARNPRTDDHKIQFLTTESAGADELMSVWGTISLQPEEKLVTKALQSIDSDIQGVGLLPPNPPRYWGPGARGGFMVKLKSSKQPVPIGSLGDGIWRMFALSMAVAQSKGGVLLVDEIDTGLHYTVMYSMWKMIYDAAKDLNVQVFATSHSQDCILSLAQIARHSDPQHTITVQRIESGKSTSVPYSGQEIALAADKEIEVR